MTINTRPDELQSQQSNLDAIKAVEYVRNSVASAHVPTYIRARDWTKFSIRHWNNCCYYGMTDTGRRHYYNVAVRDLKRE